MRKRKKKRKRIIKESLTIFIICLVAAFALAHYAVKAPTLNAQFAAEKREIQKERFDALEKEWGSNLYNDKY